MNQQIGNTGVPYVAFPEYFGIINFTPKARLSIDVSKTAAGIYYTLILSTDERRINLACSQDLAYIQEELKTWIVILENEI